MRVNMVHGILFGICIAAIACASACKQAEMDEKPSKKPASAVKVEQVKKTTPDATAATAKRTEKVKTAALDQRQRYEAFAQVRVREYTNRVAAVENSASRATGRYKGRIESNARTLGYRLGDVQAAYRQLMDAPDASWEGAKKDMDLAMQRFDDYYGRVASE